MPRWNPLETRETIETQNAVELHGISLVEIPWKRGKLLKPSEALDTRSAFRVEIPWKRGKLLKLLNRLKVNVIVVSRWNPLETRETIETGALTGMRSSGK